MAPQRTLLVTGSASGIGLTLTRRLLDAGHNVLASDLQTHTLETLAKREHWPSERLLTQRLDVTRPEDWDAALTALLERWGHLDVLYNVAGFLEAGYAQNASAELVHRHLDVNTKGVIFGSQAAARAMIPQGRGHIVNVGSLASLAPAPGLSLYVASKFAVRGFSLAFAQEIAAHGIHVTVVCPDAVDTPMLDKQVDKPEAALTFSGPRALTADEVVDVLTGVVLRKKPLEITIPRSRGALARIANTAPELARVLRPVLERQGRRNQKRARNKS